MQIIQLRLCLIIIASLIATACGTAPSNNSRASSSPPTPTSINSEAPDLIARNTETEAFEAAPTETTSPPATPAGQAASIIFLPALSSSDLSIYGGEIPTPNLDRFMANARPLHNAFWLQPDTAPLASSNPDIKFHTLTAATNAPELDAKLAQLESIYRQGYDELSKQRLFAAIQFGVLDEGSHLEFSTRGIPNWSALTAREQQRRVSNMLAYASYVMRVDQAFGLQWQRLSAKEQESLLVIAAPALDLELNLAEGWRAAVFGPYNRAHKLSRGSQRVFAAATGELAAHMSEANASNTLFYVDAFLSQLNQPRSTDEGVSSQSAFGRSLTSIETWNRASTLISIENERKIYQLPWVLLDVDGRQQLYNWQLDPTESFDLGEYFPEIKTRLSHSIRH